MRGSARAAVTARRRTESLSHQLTDKNRTNATTPLVEIVVRSCLIVADLANGETNCGIAAGRPASLSIYIGLRGGWRSSLREMA